MRYTLRRMEDHIRNLVDQNNLTAFHYDPTGGMLSADARHFYPALRLNELDQQFQALQNPARKARIQRLLLIGELTAFCYRCYEKAYQASGDQVIGRVDDLKRAGFYQRLARMMPQNPTFFVHQFQRPTARNLFQRGTYGNALLMDKWATMMNDAWILGGVHRGANFQLHSRRTLDNLWNQQGGYLVVTAREILGLREFGYGPQQMGQNTVYVRETWKGRHATLMDYENFISRAGTFRRTIDMVEQGAPSRQVMTDIRRAAGNVRHGL